MGFGKKRPDCHFCKAYLEREGDQCQYCTSGDVHLVSRTHSILVWVMVGLPVIVMAIKAYGSFR